MSLQVDGSPFKGNVFRRADVIGLPFHLHVVLNQDSVMINCSDDVTFVASGSNVFWYDAANQIVATGDSLKLQTAVLRVVPVLLLQDLWVLVSRGMLYLFLQTFFLQVQPLWV